MGDILPYSFKNKIYIISSEGQYTFHINENIIGNIDKIIELMAIDDENWKNEKMTEYGLNHALTYMTHFHERGIVLCIEACHNDLKETLIVIKQKLLNEI
jgi:hypothetical protein